MGSGTSAADPAAAGYRHLSDHRHLSGRHADVQRHQKTVDHLISLLEIVKLESLVVMFT